MSFSGQLFISLLLLVIAITAGPAAGHSFPNIDEVRAAILKHSLKIPSNKIIAELSPKNFQSSLLTFDPYARYDPPEKLFSSNSDSYGYLGIDVFQYKSGLWLASDPEGNAVMAGLPEIGILIGINDYDVSKKTLDQASEQIDISLRRKKAINLTVKDHENKIKKYQLKPVYRKPPSFFWQTRGNYLIIQIKEFIAHDTAVKIGAVCRIKAKPETIIVFDLRRCPGGDLYEAMSAAGIFIPKSVNLASTSDQSGNIKKYYSQYGYKIEKKPWVLIDSLTSSAAEIFSGILKACNAGFLIGDQTFGKCVSQTPVMLSDGGMLWLTNLDVHFSDNTSCNGKGVLPDIVYQDITTAEFSSIIERIDSVMIKDDNYNQKK